MVFYCILAKYIFLIILLKIDIMFQKKIVQNLTPFFSISLTFIVLISVAILAFPKKVLHLKINETWTYSQDVLFRNITNLGDGLFSILVIIGMSLFISYRNTIIGLLSFSISGLASIFVKRVLAPESLRPASIFDKNVLHFADGVKINYINSFTSGHTATAFALFMFLAYVCYKRKYQQVIFGITACLVAYSRVYLSQHFMIDVLFGAIIGMLSFLISYQIIIPINKKWLDSGIYKLIENKKQKVELTNK